MIQNATPDLAGAAVACPMRERRPLIHHFEALLRRLRQDGAGVPHAPYALGVTSCQPGEGVTTVAANLAIAAAQTGETSVLLVDMSLAKGTVAELFGLDPAPGVAQALSSDCLPFECIQPTKIANLSVLTAGSVQRNGSTEFAPPALAQLLATVKQEFQLIVVDMPTTDELSPCLAIAGELDGVVLVLETLRTPAHSANRAKRRLEQAQAHVLGIVVNKEA